MGTCKNCKKELTGEHCSNCGYSIKLKRIDRKYVFAEIGNVLNFERGFFYTVKELILRPGIAVRTYVFTNRKKLVKPILFIIIASILYNLSQYFFNFEAGYINFENNKERTLSGVYNWLSENYGYTNILMAIIIAFWTRLFFKKHNYNYYEIYVLMCYVMGVSILFSAMLGIVESLVEFRLLQIGLIFGLTYFTWAVGQFFDGKKKISYLKSFLSYVFGMISALVIFFITVFSVEVLFGAPNTF